MKTYVIANWKMNHLSEDVQSFKSSFSDSFDPHSDVITVICPPLCYLPLMHQWNCDVLLGAQNVSEFNNGAYTGDVSSQMVQSCGATYAIVGHSERRQLFNETDTVVQQKIARCIESQIIPIVCVGETLQEREANQTNTVISQQLSVLKEVSSFYLVAYEPIWAIGTGQSATPQMIHDVHQTIRQQVHDDAPILYGGSVKPNNIDEIFSIGLVNGALVGGASLNSESLISLVNSAASRLVTQ